MCSLKSRLRTELPCQKEYLFSLSEFTFFLYHIFVNTRPWNTQYILQSYRIPCLYLVPQYTSSQQFNFKIWSHKVSTNLLDQNIHRNCSHYTFFILTYNTIFPEDQKYILHIKYLYKPTTVISHHTFFSNQWILNFSFWWQTMIQF